MLFNRSLTEALPYLILRAETHYIGIRAGCVRGARRRGESTRQQVLTIPDSRSYRRMASGEETPSNMSEMDQQEEAVRSSILRVNLGICLCSLDSSTRRTCPVQRC